jgi:hypothetical protein
MAGEIASARSYTGVFYVGLGDQFDDDRRLVGRQRQSYRPEIHPTRAGEEAQLISVKLTAHLD